MQIMRNHLPLSVYYDGECPVCRQEVALYRRMDTAQRVVWIDILTLADAELPQMKSRGDLLGRFHARAGNGAWMIGVDAFAAIWDRSPGLRHLAFLFRTPGIRQLAKVGYLGFLAWQRRDRARRELSRASATASAAPVVRS